MELQKPFVGKILYSFAEVSEGDARVQAAVNRRHPSEETDIKKKIKFQLNQESSNNK